VRVGGNGGGNTAATTVFGSNNFIDNLGFSATLSVIGTNQTIQNDAQGYIYLGSNTSVTDKGTGNTFNTAAGDAITANGDTVRVGGNGGGNTAVTTVFGSNNFIDDLGFNNTLAVVGTNQTVQNVAQGSIYLGSSTSVTDKGAGNVINTADNDYINATSDVVNVGANSVSTILKGAYDTVNGGTGAAFTLGGNHNTLNFGASSSLSIIGDTDNVSTGLGSSLFLDGTSDTISASHSKIETGAAINGGVVYINGDNNYIESWIYGSKDTTFVFTGTGNTILADNAHFTFTQGLNANNKVWGIADTVNGGANNTAQGTTLPVNAGYYPNTPGTVNFVGTGVTVPGPVGNVTINYSCPDGSSDPIILNLEGDRVQTQGLANSSAFFDMQNNGQKVHTGWATAGEGMLVYDPNNTDMVTNDSNLVAGFGALSTLAHQTGGTLDASNSLWSKLKVWIDPTGGGNVQQGKLESLDELGISSINLGSTAENVNSNGNTILNDSTFTWNDGLAGDIAGVNLTFNPNAIANKSALSAASGNNSGVTSFASLHHLIQSMAAFTDGSTGIDPTFSSASANTDVFHLAASHIARHAC